MTRIVIFSATVLLASACTDTVTAPLAAPGEAFLSQSRPAALHDLTTPTLSGGVNGSTVSLSWTPADLQADCDAAAAANEGSDATTCWGVHWEVYRNGVKVAEPTTSGYSDADLPEGSYTYTVKGKGMEGTPGPTVYTHHSLESNPVVLQVVTAGAACLAPTVTLLSSATSIVTGGGNTETVDLSGTTANVVDCAGGSLEYRVVDNTPGGPGGDHSVGWTALTPAANGSYAFSATLRTAQVGRTYTFTTRVKNDDNTTWVESAPLVVTVISAGGGGSSAQGGRGM
jgi:hypothetical protein